MLYIILYFLYFRTLYDYLYWKSIQDDKKKILRYELFNLWLQFNRFRSCRKVFVVLFYHKKILLTEIIRFSVETSTNLKSYTTFLLIRLWDEEKTNLKWRIKILSKLHHDANFVSVYIVRYKFLKAYKIKSNVCPDIWTGCDGAHRRGRVQVFCVDWSWTDG